MTEHDLTTLVRDHVASDEPPFALSPDTVVRGGRRTVRHRRLAAGGAALAVLAVGAITVPQVLDGDTARGHSTAVDPATAAFLEDYDAAQMPRILEEESRAVFERSVEDLGEATFHAGDNQGAALPPKWWDRASGMTLSYGGTSDHRLSVDLAHARSEAEGSAQRYCEESLEGGFYLECAVDVRDDGSVVISNLWALRPYGGATFMAVERDQLATIDPDRLWFERRVKVIKSETFVTYVSETVKASSEQAARAAFQVPQADLAELGTDPQVVIPAPEPDPASGCPGFVLPGTVTCGTFDEPDAEGGDGGPAGDTGPMSPGVEPSPAG
ncbi:hypothetical protein [Nocardioides sp. cx-173]|uniref:hypothetical protein n=1 Tax=Nocardioides sp. cx-173 TaxID=2898796 RepID=UPI001E33D0ED|nr:hypothetical protein [Nocardioides sp. cx-173]MCD4526319.1 hypothetical protein [Nocardioides sp. cx-173]UGB43495.1 hypothetical protein LQ940_08185 [Nocardioides sp. cx-173]